MGLGGLEPPTSPLSVVTELLAAIRNEMLQSAIRLCLCSFGARGPLLRPTTIDDEW